jgi:hypothetical protein
MGGGERDKVNSLHPAREGGGVMSGTKCFLACVELVVGGGLL